MAVTLVIEGDEAEYLAIPLTSPLMACVCNPRPPLPWASLWASFLVPNPTASLKRA